MQLAEDRHSGATLPDQFADDNPCCVTREAPVSFCTWLLFCTDAQSSPNEDVVLDTIESVEISVAVPWYE